MAAPARKKKSDSRKSDKSRSKAKSKAGSSGKAKKKASPKKKSAKKKAGKQARSGKAAGKKKDARSAMEPAPVSTGRGPGPLEVAQQVVALLRAGDAAAVEEGWLSPGIESVEGVGVSMAWAGKKAVLAKYRAWEADHEIHDMTLEGPWVGATGFVLRLGIDVTQKSTGQRSRMEEMAVYTVRDGRIVREEFHFATDG